MPKPTTPSHVATNSITERIASNVRAEMSRSSHTQTSLADLIPLSQTALSRRLTGAIPFDVAELGEIANALGVPLSVLTDVRATA